MPVEASYPSIAVSVPATTANLGPGFDCLGLALSLRNEAVFETHPGSSYEVEIQGFGGDTLPLGFENLIVRSAQRLFEFAGSAIPGLRIRCTNSIPPGSGLGSSSAAILTGLLGANLLLNDPLSKDAVLDLAARLEGHPDNVAPALLGGLTMSAAANSGGWLTRRLALPDWWAAVVVPEIDLPTTQARSILPGLVPRQDAVFNIGHALLVVEALRSGDADLLRAGMQDRLHQPQRLDLIPGALEALELSARLGAAVCLSGAGPGVIAFFRQADLAYRAGEELSRPFQDRNISTWLWIGQLSNQGAQAEIRKPPK